MANTSRSNGFKPVKTLSGAPWTGMVRYVDTAAADRSSDTTNNHGDIYIGDPITINTDKTVVPSNSDLLVSGVVVGVGESGNVTHGRAGMWDPTDLTKRYLAYNEAGRVFYVPVNDMLFEVEEASDLDFAPGSLADITTDAAEAHGSRTSGLSSCKITTASNNDVQVVEHLVKPDNDPTITAARYIVMFKQIGLAPRNSA